MLIDFTDRTLQNEAKKAGFPWCLAKGQDSFLPVSQFVEKEKVADPYKLTISLSVNGK